jgi:hypothetical protein
MSSVTETSTSVLGKQGEAQSGRFEKNPVLEGAAELLDGFIPEPTEDGLIQNK